MSVIITWLEKIPVNLSSNAVIIQQKIDGRKTVTRYPRPKGPAQPRRLPN